MSVNPESGRHHRRRRSSNDGFTLVEVLVSFTVMATLLAVLFRGVVTMRAGAVAFDDHMHQDVVARAILDDALVNRDLSAGSYTGMRDGLRWRLDARSIDVSAQLVPPDQGDVAVSGAAPAAAGQTAPAQPATTGDTAALKKTSQKPQWMPQRLTVRVETNGRPLEIETIRLVKAEAGP